MIKNNQSLSLAEASEYLKKRKDAEVDVMGFIKNFTKASPKEAKELRKKLEELNLMKINRDHISKLIDLLPENKRDLSKIFPGINLEEDETNKILETIKKFR